MGQSGMDIMLLIDTDRNAVLNTDGVTLLRNIYLAQGATYNVYLAFYDDGALTTPDIASFSFTASNGATVLFDSTILSNSGNASYPKRFTIVADSPALSAALTDLEEIGLSAVISWSNGATTTTLAPFTAKVTASTTADSASIVNSLNGLSGEVVITGSGLTVSTAGNNVTIDAAQPYQSYSTPLAAETKTLTVSSPFLWLVNATNSDATFNLPDATLVAGREYTLTKTDASAHILAAIAYGSQRIEGRQGVYVSGQWESIHLRAAGGNWLVLDALNIIDP